MLAIRICQAIRVECLVVCHHILKVNRFVALCEKCRRCITAVVFQLRVIYLVCLTFTYGVISFLLLLSWRRLYTFR
jgi:hypothetical protein